MQIKQKRIIRSFFFVEFYLLCGAILLLVGCGYIHSIRLLIVGVILLLSEMIGFLLFIVLRAKHHKLKNGIKYAKLHSKMENLLIQSLYDDGYFVEREILFQKCAVIPRLL